MMTFVIGGSGSGKSAYGEQYLSDHSSGRTNYYIAAMEASDQESRERIVRHRKARKNRNFLTIEQPVRIQDALNRMAPGEKGAILECVSTLVANEMFGGAGERTEAEVEEAVVEGIAALKGELDPFVVVSNQVFEDGNAYEEATMAYIRVMGRIHGRLAAMADGVVEVVAGIPLWVKKGGDAGTCREAAGDGISADPGMSENGR